MLGTRCSILIARTSHYKLHSFNTCYRCAMHTTLPTEVNKMHNFDFRKVQHMRRRKPRTLKLV